jgi:hypothetical protein
MGRPRPSLLRHLFRRLESEKYAAPVATSVLGRYVVDYDSTMSLAHTAALLP